MPDPRSVVTYSKSAKFEDVRDGLTLAIEAKGLLDAISSDTLDLR